MTTGTGGASEYGGDPQSNNADRTRRGPLGRSRNSPVDVVIPNGRFPRDATGQMTPAGLSAIAQSSAPQQVMMAARDAVIQIIYGGPERTAGLLYLARVHPNGNLVLCLVMCEGQVDSFNTVELNDQPLSSIGTAGSTTTYSNGVKMTAYLGTATQTVDATLAACISGFTEAMQGTAYAVFEVPKGVSQGFPRFTIEVKGRKVYDPRDGAQSSTNPTTWVWSDNPALILADFLSSATYGAKKTVDWTSVTAAANYVDATVTGTAGTEKRAVLSLTLADKRAVREWIEVLRAYLPGWVDYVGPTAVIVADMTRSNDHTFTATNIDTEPKPSLRKRGVKDLPTVVQVGYMKTDVKPWAMAYGEASTGSAARRIARIDMPGIRRYSQARRFAVERLNHYQLEDLEAAIGVFEDGLKVTLGDIATVTDDIGLSAKKMRVMGKEDRGFGRWTLSLREYDPAAYSGVVETAPTTPDTGLPNPSTVAAATALTITETVFLERLGGSTLAGNLIYQSRFDCAWTAPVHAYPFVYRVEVLDGATKLRDELVTAAAYSTPAVQQGKSYTIKVYVRNSLGFESTALVGTQIAQGKLLPPGPVLALRGYETGGEVHLDYDAAVDIDVARYEHRYTPNQTAGGSWAGGVLIDRVDGLRAVFKGLPVGTHRFYVRAIDSVGNYSTSDCTLDITITSDASAFVQDHTFSSPTLSNMMAIRALEGVGKARWETAFAGDVWTTVEPNPFNSGSNPVDSYHAAGTSKWTGDNWDVGSSVTADWTLTAAYTDISGTATVGIETSPDGSVWTLQPGISFRGPARYVRPVLQSTGTLRVDAPPSIRLSALAKPETGTATTAASGITLVALTGKYSAAQDLQATALGATARTATYDRLMLHPQSGLMMSWDVSTGSVDSSALVRFWTGARTLLADDYLEYEVFIDPSTPASATFTASTRRNTGSLFPHTTAAGGTYLAAFTDTISGLSTRDDAAIETGARGAWQARKIALGAFVGQSLDACDMGGDSDTNSDASHPYKVLIRNVRITNGAGTDRLSLWGTALQTEPNTNVTTVTGGNATNIRMGPANTFTLYAFNSSGTQVANDVRWSFKGF